MRSRERRMVARRRIVSQSHSSQTVSISPEYARTQTRESPRHSSETREEFGTERGRTRRINFRRGPQQARQSTEPLANKLALAIHNLGLGANSKHPEPEKFKIESGESFSQFVILLQCNIRQYRRLEKSIKYYLSLSII